MHTFKLFRRLAPYVKIKWNLTLIAYVCTFLQLGLVMLQPLIFAYLIDHVLIGGNRKLIVPLLSLSLGIGVLSIVFLFIRVGLFRYLGICNTLDIRDELLKHVRQIPIPEIQKQGPGKFSALLGMDTATMGNFLNHILVEITSQLFMMLISLGILYYMDWRLGIVATVSIPFLLWVPGLFRNPVARYSSDVRTHNEEIGTYLYEAIESSQEIRALGLEGWERKRNEKMYKGLVKASTRETLYAVMSFQISGFVISLILAAIYWIGSYQVLHQIMTVGMMVASVTYLQNALNPVQQINNYFRELQGTEVAMGRIEQFIQTPIDPYSENERKQVSPAREPQLEATPSDIEVRNLRVGYGGTEILKELSLSLSPGKVYAFVGRSGSGKSTLFRALIGMMPVLEGEIRIGGQNLEEMTRSAISRKVGIVFQEPYLFRGTLMENISIGKLDATEEMVMQAALNARLGSLLDQLPEGLNTKIDHRGFQLSGGQRQRLAIARVLLHNPDILILDEPTSALDQLTESELMDSIRHAMAGKTVLVATHRLQTIMNADRILVMENGCLVAEGDHEELMNQSAEYYAMASTFERDASVAGQASHKEGVPA
ncbi:ABC transporter ATP-binding protein [Paenibacillus typhae]|uniref:ABC transporter ATP-binding protein n=1 Tax=Paenibacillus typhae TaxID=1174501 RepID=UPI001C8F0423|nr:ABC transporter ATP-binding protein [Paenibacillus typhae]MBY0012146.1 ABC transporter ATP-binding protein [Paenibacillus typhae]